MSLLVSRNVTRSGLILARTLPANRIGMPAAARLYSAIHTQTSLEVPHRSRTADADGSAAALAAGRAHATRLAGLHIPSDSSPHAALASEARHLDLGASAAANIAGMHTSTSSSAAALGLSQHDVDAENKAPEGLVGHQGRGTEGAHYNDKLPEAAAPLTDLAIDSMGGWTMMNPIYTEAELDTVKVVNRAPVTLSDKAAHGVVKLLRRCFDMFTGYIAKPIPAEVLAQNPIPIAELRKSGQLLSDKAWLLRIILLESIAGVPGMVGGTLRHLRSLRLLRRDGGWIHTLLEEAENERMHLLTFLTVAQPTLITRALVLAAQGVFYNVFFLTYLVAPKTAHRFVGALEEEAVRTYTHCIEDVTNGLVPEWNDKPAPQIAIDYWRMPADSTLLDVIKAVRADEATHRFVNHSLANLNQKEDFNPFALAEASPELRGTRAGFTREESAEFARQTQSRMLGAPRANKEDAE